MKKSKFVGKEFDNGWVCTGCNLAANYSHGTRHNRYWYAFERRTSDGKFDKWIRVEAHEATRIYKGLISVEDICGLREASSADCGHMHGINYQFVGSKQKNS